MGGGVIPWGEAELLRTSPGLRHTIDAPTGEGKRGTLPWKRELEFSAPLKEGIEDVKQHRVIPEIRDKGLIVGKRCD